MKVSNHGISSKQMQDLTRCNHRELKRLTDRLQIEPERLNKRLVMYSPEQICKILDHLITRDTDRVRLLTMNLTNMKGKLSEWAQWCAEANK